MMTKGIDWLDESGVLFFFLDLACPAFLGSLVATFLTISLLASIRKGGLIYALVLGMVRQGLWSANQHGADEG